MIECDIKNLISNKISQDALNIYDNVSREGFPFNVEKFAEKIGFNVNFINFLDDNVSGRMILDKDKNPISIEINNGDGEARQRFTIAHELGHFIWKHEPDEICEKTGNKIYYRRRKEEEETKIPINWKQELQANDVAAEILMPIDEFVNKYRSYPDDIFELSRYFKVSIDSAFKRTSEVKSQIFLGD